MKLTEIFNALTYGELSHLNIGGAEGNGITQENQVRILSHLNLGLTALHTRFLLKRGELTLGLVPGLQRYPLHKQYAVANLESWEPIKFIQDSEQLPFTGGVLKVVQVFDGLGNELRLNGSAGKLRPGLNTYPSWEIPQVYTPSLDTLILQDAVEGETLKVVYQADHARIFREDNSFDPEEIEVELPHTHMEALLFYIAARLISPLGVSGDFHEGNNYMARYEQACMQLEDQGMQVVEFQETSRLVRNGWV